MTNCATCKHFDADDHDDHRGDVVADTSGQWGRCELANTGRDSGGVRDRLFYAQDAEEYSAWLVVRADHGCNAWSSA